MELSGVPLNLSFDKVVRNTYYCPQYGVIGKMLTIKPQVDPDSLYPIIIECENTDCATHQDHPSKQKNG